MHKDTLSWLGEAGLSAPPPQSLATDEPPLSDTNSADEPQPSIVADLDLDDLGDSDGDGDDGADDDCPSDPEDYGEPGRHRENTELVAAAFRAAGNPKYQDVRLKLAKTSNCPNLTHREFALGRAKRLKGSTTW